MPKSKKQPAKPAAKKVSAAKGAKATKVTVADLKASGNGTAPHHRIIRVASVLNPQTKHAVLVGATLDGKISDPRIASRLKIKRTLQSWREIEAESWAAATAAFRAGKGTPVTAK